MITKIEFINRTDVGEVSPTVLATYTEIYDEDFRVKENSNPASFDIQTPRTLTFTLDTDDFLIDDVMDSSNDYISYVVVSTNPTVYKTINTQICNKIIKVYENDVYTYVGLIEADDMSRIDEELKITFTAQDPTMLFSKVRDVDYTDSLAVFGNPQNMNTTLDFISGYALGYFGWGGYFIIFPPSIETVQDFDYVGNIYYTDRVIDLIVNPILGISIVTHGLTDELNYMDSVSVSLNSGVYKVEIQTYDKSYKDGDRVISAGFASLALAEAHILSLGYSAGFISSMVDNLTTFTITTTDNRKYDSVPATIILLTILFTGQSFVTTVKYIDGDINVGQLIDCIYTMNNLQVQMDYSTGVPRYVLTNKDSQTDNSVTVDVNDVIEFERERATFENTDTSVFDIISEDEGERQSVIDNIEIYYTDFKTNVRSKASFLLSNLFNIYSLDLDHVLTYDGLKYKISRIGKESEKIQKIDVLLISKGIEVLYPNGGEQLLIGGIIDVQWRTIATESTEAMKIELYKADVLHSVIIASTTNTGSYNWDTTGIATSTATDYKIKITLISDTAINDLSDEDFELLYSP